MWEEIFQTHTYVGRAWGSQTNIINAKLCEILEGDKSSETIEDFNGISSDGEELQY